MRIKATLSNDFRNGHKSPEGLLCLFLKSLDNVAKPVYFYLTSTILNFQNETVMILLAKDYYFFNLLM